MVSPEELAFSRSNQTSRTLGVRPCRKKGQNGFLFSLPDPKEKCGKGPAYLEESTGAFVLDQVLDHRQTALPLRRHQPMSEFEIWLHATE